MAAFSDHAPAPPDPPPPLTLDDIRRVVREEAMAAMKTLLAELQRK